MKTIVFAGEAIIDGEKFSRSEVRLAALLRGFKIREFVDKHTDLVVSSQDDHTKAKAAKNLGVPVLTYQDFANAHLLPNGPTKMDLAKRFVERANEAR